MNVIYLDNCATTRVDDEVLAAMLPYLREEFGNPSSPHVLGKRARRAVETAAGSVAALVGADATAADGQQAVVQARTLLDFCARRSGPIAR